MGQKVLVVDDEPSVGSLLSEFLEMKGYQVIVSTNPVAGLGSIQSHQPDLVILDLLFPLIDGLDILVQIKKQHPRLPVLILTGAGYDAEIMKAAQEIGADGFVSKGVLLEQLLMEVHRVLRHAAPGPSAR